MNSPNLKGFEIGDFYLGESDRPKNMQQVLWYLKGIILIHLINTNF